jgi:hypothetical protein
VLLLGTVWYEGSCFTGFCKVVCGYGVWQAGLGGSLLPGSVLGLAVLFGIGFVCSIAHRVLVRSCL